jgi:nucleotide-binding universal stress UspA family protein
MILLCYDGSADAQAAVDVAARTMPGAEATVLTIWETSLDAMARSSSMGAGWGLAMGYDDDGKIDRANEQAARDSAQEGAGRARDAGLRAQPRIASRHGDIADTILLEAAELDVDLIVVGTRGRGDVKSFLLGSVSHHLVQHADRAVTVVPSAELAEQRRDLHHTEVDGSTP